jgi:hypothetical protein
MFLEKLTADKSAFIAQDKGEIIHEAVFPPKD